MSENANPTPQPNAKQDLATMLKQREKQPRSRLTTILILVIVLLVGVLLGVPLGKASSSSSAGGRFPTPGASGMPMAPGGTMPSGTVPSGGTPGGTMPGGFGGRPTSGTVTKVDGTTLTITTQDGSEVTVTTTDQTKVTESAQVPVSRLAEGTTVMIIGQTSDDGSVAADRIIAGDSGFGGPLGAGPAGQ